MFSGTSLDFSFDSAWITAIIDIVRFVAWVLPLDAILVCFGVSVVTLLFRLAVAIYRLIPFNG